MTIPFAPAFASKIAHFCVKKCSSGVQPDLYFCLELVVFADKIKVQKEWSLAPNAQYKDVYSL